MPSGEMRRPPQPWESKLARLTSIIGGAGIKSSGDGTSGVAPVPPPGTGGGTEPAPVLPPPGAFIKPSTPSLLGQPQGINVIWNGLNSAGDLWPYDTSFVEIHMSTAGTGFTPGTATLKGRLARPGSYSVGGLTAGTTYFFRLRGADPAGNYTEPSDAASSQTGQVIQGDLGTGAVGTAQINFNARTIGGVSNSVQSSAPSNPLQGDVWLDTSPGTAVIHKVYNGTTWVTNAWGSASIAAGQITALQLAAGAVTAGAITAGTINGWYIKSSTLESGSIVGGTISGGLVTGGTISGGFISGGTIDGATITSTSISGYATSNDIANFITGGQVNSNVTSISGGVITSGTIIGRTVQSASSGKRIVVDAGVNEIQFWNTLGTKTADVYPATVSGNDGLGITGALDVTSLISGQSLSINGASVDFPGVTTGSTTADAGFNNDRLRKKTSSKRYKYDIAAADGDFVDVEDAKRSDVVTVSLADVLSIGVAEFSWLEDGEPSDKRDLGFIAEDVAQKFPLAVGRDPDGTPIAVRDTPILAALLAVVRKQQQTITDLTARIDALEGN